MTNTKEKTKFTPVGTIKWLFFDLNSFFASVEQQENKDLRGKPVAVVPMMTDGTCAIAASYEAKAYGIKTGTKIYEAKKMCPDLVCVLAKHDIYVKYHDWIMDEVENHTHITKTYSIDEAACELYSNENTPEKINQIARNIKQGLRDNVGEYIKCSIGAAQNVFLAKLASDMQKPDGLTILAPNDYKDILFKQSLRSLTGIGAQTEKRLNHAGIYTIEQLWNIEPKHARKIWGNVAGEKFWYKLHGYEIPEATTQKSVVGHSRVLDPEHRHPTLAFNITKQLTIKAATRLRRCNLYARKFSLSVRSMNKTHWERYTSFSPAQDNFTFINSLERMWHDMVIDIGDTNLKKVSITIHDLHEREQITMDLFGNNSIEEHNNSALSSTIDAINKRFGKQAVTIGMHQKTAADHVGTKIAFTRIPEKEEFHE
ncbi:MAG: Y-family DNA polymerase [Alphaproteobacteria bacterium]